MKSAVIADAGNIVEVNAKVVAGNLTARIDTNGNTTPQAGGNIFSVYSKKAIPKNVTLSADWYIYKIEVADPGQVAETFKVDAQGGATWNVGQTTFQAQGPLFIDVGTARYLGRVRFRNRSSDIADATFRADTLLLQVADTENGVRTYSLWTVTGNDPNPTTVKATFAKLTNGSYGYVKNKTKLSNEELSLFGSSGNESQ